jgi:hypothetical protein
VADAVQDVAGRTRQYAEDLGNLVQAADHLPQPAFHLDPFELGDGVARQHLDQLARGMRDEMQTMVLLMGPSWSSRLPTQR